MKNAFLTLVFCASLALSATIVCAKEDRPYTEGPVSDISFIKTQPGMFEQYMKWIGTVWKQVVDEEKKEGIITGYNVYAVEPRCPDEPDVILSITFANMAALDNLDDRMDAVAEKVEGSVQKANENAIGREKLRRVLGSELVREMVLK